MGGRVGAEVSEPWASKTVGITMLQASAVLATTDTVAVLPVGPLSR